MAARRLKGCIIIKPVIKNYYSKTHWKYKISVINSQWANSKKIKIDGYFKLRTFFTFLPDAALFHVDKLTQKNFDNCSDHMFTLYGSISIPHIPYKLITIFL